MKRVGHPVVKTKDAQHGEDTLHLAVTATVKRAEEIPTSAGGAEMMTATTEEDIAPETGDAQNTTVAQVQTDTVVDLNKSQKKRKLKHLLNLRVKCSQPLWVVSICLHTK